MEKQHDLFALNVGRPAGGRDHQVDAAVRHGLGFDQPKLAKGVGLVMSALDALANGYFDFRVRKTVMEPIALVCDGSDEN